jgi:hypothetical protein
VEKIPDKSKEIKEKVSRDAEITAPQSSGNILEQLDQFDSSESVPDSPSDQLTPPEPEKIQEFSNMPETPLPQESTPFYQQIETPNEQIQEIAESIIEEKWQEMNSKIGDLSLWRDRVENDITSVKQEILRTQDHFKSLQSAVLGKVSEYNKNILNINTEMKALEKVLEKIIQPLTTNVKELDKITKKLKLKF